MTRSNRKKNYKRVKKLIKKLKDDYSNLKKHYKEEINKLNIELWNKEYYIRSILDFLKDISHNPRDIPVHNGFRSMCNEG